MHFMLDGLLKWCGSEAKRTGCGAEYRAALCTLADAIRQVQKFF